jgi:hypothetical protein
MAHIRDILSSVLLIRRLLFLLAEGAVSTRRRSLVLVEPVGKGWLDESLPVGLAMTCASST